MKLPVSSCCFVITLLTALTLHAQPAQPPRPTRDTAATTKLETSVIKGRVVSAEGKPLRRAQVRASAPELRDGRTISTDTDGNYELTNLPAGRYTIRFTRSGYLPLSYGQKYPGEAGKQVQIKEGETITGIDVALPRAGVIAGRIVDEIGDPVAGVMVYAMQNRFFQGRRRVVPVESVTRTDDSGLFRVVGLPPGEFYIFGSIRESWVVSSNREKTVMAFAPTYYPGTASLPAAQRIKVGIGQEVSGIDFPLAVGRAASIAGVALDSSGAPIAGGSVSLSQEFRGPGGMSMMAAGAATAGSDGTWRLTNIPPGDYRIAARGVIGTRQESVTQSITVDGADLEGVVLAAGASPPISGQIVIDGTPKAPIALTRLRVFSRNLENNPVPVSSSSGTVDQQGNFQLDGVVGTQRLTVGAIPDGWAIKSVEREGRDITDVDIELSSGERVDGVRITLTDRLTLVRGAVLDDREQHTSSGTIVVFAEDSRFWGENSRYVRGVRPSQSGEFEIKGLPPGSYRAIAVEYLPDGDWNDPEVLASFNDRAARLIITDAEAKTVNLPLQK